MNKFELTIKQTGVNLEDLIKRLQNMKPVFKATLAPKMQEAGSYQRPDRFEGGPGRPGEISTWAPGYRKHQHLHVRNRRVYAQYTRPYPPLFTDSAIAEMTESIVRFVVENTT